MLFAFSDNKALAQSTGISEAINSDNVTIQNDLNQPSIFPIDTTKMKSILILGGLSHFVMDFYVNEGENVVSTAAGIVAEAKYDSEGGNYVIIQHDEIYEENLRNCLKIE